MPYRAFDNQDIGDVFTGTRVCRKCNERKPMDQFHWTGSRIHRFRKCKVCTQLNQSLHYAKQRESNPEEFLHKAFVGHLRNKHGLIEDEFKKLWDSQDGLCAICRNKLGKKKFNNFHVDHDHVSGEIRGLLCFTCNTGLGKFYDNVEFLRNAIEYLLRPNPVVNIRNKLRTPEELHVIRSVSSRKNWNNPIYVERLREVHRGENNPAAKLTDLQVDEIITRYKQGGISQYTLADQFNVSQGLISAIVLGKTRVQKRSENGLRT